MDRAQWLALVKELHPDRNPDPDAARRLAEINAAYANPENVAPAAPLAAAAFTVDDFRPVVFEALIVAAADVGDVTDSDEPFTVDIRTGDGFVHIELLPEAGGSLVAIDSDGPDVSDVAAVLAAGLRALGLVVR